MTLFEELSHRDGLRVALAGRDDVSLAPILRFLLRHVANPRYSAVLLDVCSLVLGPCPSCPSQAFGAPHPNPSEPLTPVLSSPLPHAHADLYTSAIGQSMVVDELIAKLRVRIRQEVGFQNQLQTLLGTLDLLFAAAANARTGTSPGRDVDPASLGAVDGADADADDGDARKDGGQGDMDDDDDSDNGDVKDEDDDEDADDDLPNGDAVASKGQRRRAQASTSADGDDDDDDEDEDEDEDDGDSDDEDVDLLAGSDDDDGSDADLNVMAAFGLTDDGDDDAAGADDTWATGVATSRRARRLQAVEARESESEDEDEDEDENDEVQDEDQDEDDGRQRKRATNGVPGDEEEGADSEDDGAEEEEEEEEST